jgi:hypothetical protein
MATHKGAFAQSRQREGDPLGGGRIGGIEHQLHAQPPGHAVALDDRHHQRGELDQVERATAAFGGGRRACRRRGEERGGEKQRQADRWHRISMNRGALGRTPGASSSADKAMRL